MEGKVPAHEIIPHKPGWSLSVCVKLLKLLWPQIVELFCWLLYSVFGIKIKCALGVAKQCPVVLMCFKSECNICVQNSPVKLSSPGAKPRLFYFFPYFTCRTFFHFGFCILTVAQQRWCLCSWQICVCHCRQVLKRAEPTSCEPLGRRVWGQCLMQGENRYFWRNYIK